MILNQIHHIAIIVSDYEVSKHFYVDILGFKIIHEEYRKERKSYKLDLALENGPQIELFSFPESPKRASYPEACGLRHLAFQTDNIENAVKELRSKNIETEPIRIDQITFKKFTFFSDPDGLPLELYEL